MPFVQISTETFFFHTKYLQKLTISQTFAFIDASKKHACIDLYFLHAARWVSGLPSSCATNCLIDCGYEE
jgi:hypothetical protein